MTETMQGMVSVLVIAGVVVGAFIALVLVLRTLLFLCRPNEILVFSGRKHKLPDGSISGYKILHGGNGVRIPFLETVHRMDMRLFPVEVAVNNAYSKGGIPLSVHAIANVKISSSDEGVRNAVERFLGTNMQAVALTAQQTLEGVLREVVSQLTPEEVNEDRLKFADTLVENARDDLDKLGLDLDVLKVQHVSDEQQYLANLGRGRIATMLRDAANAENAANQSVSEAQAGARMRAETTAKKAETRILQARNNYRAEVAKLEATAKQVENEAEIAAQTERAIAEQELQAMRGELEKLRLHNDVILPAEAQRKASELKARAEAAPTIENGKARAEALRAVAAEWAAAGPDGRDVYVLQQLRALVTIAAGRVAQTQIEDLQVVDGGDGDALGSVLAAYPAAVARVLMETGHAVGVDIAALLVPRNAEGERPIEAEPVSSKPGREGEPS